MTKSERASIVSKGVGITPRPMEMESGPGCLHRGLAGPYSRNAIKSLSLLWSRSTLMRDFTRNLLSISDASDYLFQCLRIHRELDYTMSVSLVIEDALSTRLLLSN